MSNDFPASFGDALVELPEPAYRLMREIVRVVAESKPFQGEGYRECLFCDLPDGETHESSCIVTKARALVAQAKEQP